MEAASLRALTLHWSSQVSNAWAASKPVWRKGRQKREEDDGTEESFSCPN